MFWQRVLRLLPRIVACGRRRRVFCAHLRGMGIGWTLWVIEVDAGFRGRGGAQRRLALSWSSLGLTFDMEPFQIKLSSKSQLY